ncbi:MAG: hypothetical protein L6R40_005829 [Gallowayella cf. fulva]|nr:MAG: hypothetical protein L6R40_005829 [Xanthomendoza cf. fulva]
MSAGSISEPLMPSPTIINDHQRPNIRPWEAAVEQDYISNLSRNCFPTTTITLLPESSIGLHKPFTTFYKILIPCPSSQPFESSASHAHLNHIISQIGRPAASASSRVETDRFIHHSVGLGLGIPAVMLIIGLFVFCFWVWVRSGQPKLAEKPNGRRETAGRPSGSVAAGTGNPTMVSNVAASTNAGLDVELRPIPASTARDGKPAALGRTEAKPARGA